MEQYPWYHLIHIERNRQVIFKAQTGGKNDKSVKKQPYGTSSDVKKFHKSFLLKSNV